MLYRFARFQSSRFFIVAGSLLTAGFLSLPTPGLAATATKPKGLAEIALYQGRDREPLLIEGAKKEGQVTFYTSNTWMASALPQAFEKKYPFVKVMVWRSDSKELLKRVTEEYASGRLIADVLETSPEYMALLHKNGMLQEHYSPEMAFYGDEVKTKGKNGVVYWANREIYISLGFNTKLVPTAEAPRSLKDLLDPKWKGKMSIAGTTTGVQWVGNLLDAMGREFLEKMSQQQVNVQNMSGAALAGLVASGEVPLSPTIFDSNITTARQKGAPVEWRPLEPVIASVGKSGLLNKVPHPHAALLFLDYIHSREGQQVAMKGGLNSPRSDIGSLETKFKKTYLEAKYSLEEYEKRFAEWEALMRQLFISRR
jgi:iron(III) transport system substrate-binding protein